MTYDDAFRKYYSVIVKYCASRVDWSSAEDVASDAFLILYRKWDELRSHENKVLLVWLYRTADNLIKEMWRARKIEIVSMSDETVTRQVEQKLQEAEEIDAYEEIIRSERYVLDIKKELKDGEWQLFEYIVVKKYSYRKVAEILNLSVAAVKMRWYRLQAKMRPIFDRLAAKNL